MNLSRFAHRSVKRRVRAALHAICAGVAEEAAPTAIYGGGTAPSFGDLVARRGEWLFEHLPRAAAEFHYNLHGKDEQKRFAERIGVPTAETYLMDATLDEALAHADERALERFVVKPVAGRSSVGCICVVRDGDHYVDVESGQRFDRNELRRRAVRAFRRLGGERSDAWLLEELLLPYGGEIAPLEDYKAYCFGGRLEAMLVKRRVRVGGRKHQLVQWYTRDWEPVNVTISNHEYMLPLAAPVNGRRLVEMAERVASRYCAPFIRVDLYDSSRGVLLGELTPGPGGRELVSPSWNYRFTKRWYEAERALRAGLRSGAIRPLLPAAAAESRPLAVQPEAVPSAA